MRACGEGEVSDKTQCVLQSRMMNILRGEQISEIERVCVCGGETDIMRLRVCVCEWGRGDRHHEIERVCVCEWGKQTWCCEWSRDQNALTRERSDVGRRNSRQ